MSAPDTNVKKQEKAHKPSLLGIKGVLVFAGVLLAGLIVWTFVQSDGVDGSDVQVDSRTGEVVGTE
ncbi:hypothetical protein DU478_04705 [Thalassococcus profundi]|uniref:HlyD family secretion protein n=1 Tax=Thalassococcus profundi TaxID=2282382 RepID=A0A369TSE3_9RHOB|nr:hypothetical protein [Thalassococcus profundi]RDD67047.1 hypothetical protein DU478_04705 [Thalassococcus profundi]